MFKLSFAGEVKEVEKTDHSEFSEKHKKIILSLSFENGKISFSNANWKSIYLGAGEEKAVFCVCDDNNRVFALELIDEKHYLNGRLVDGIYFYSTRVGSIRNIKFNKDSVVGLTLTGLVKAREFIFGYEWGLFQLYLTRKHWIDSILTGYLQTFFISKFNDYNDRYKDVHDRNVMFEIRNYDKKGIPILAKDIDNRLKLYKIGIRPIDVR